MLRQTRASKCSWDYVAIYVSEIRSCMAHQLYKLHGRTPYEIVAGDTPNITEWLEYDFYQPVWFYSPAVFPVEKQLLRRWLGVAHRVGQALCYWILPVSGVPIARSMVQPISKDDLATNEVGDELASYNMSIAVFFAKKNHKYLWQPYFMLFTLHFRVSYQYGLQVCIHLYKVQDFTFCWRLRQRRRAAFTACAWCAPSISSERAI